MSERPNYVTGWRDPITTVIIYVAFCVCIGLDWPRMGTAALSLLGFWVGAVSLCNDVARTRYKRRGLWRSGHE